MDIRGFIFLVIASICLWFFMPRLHAEELNNCTANKYVIKNLERRMTKKIIKVWHKEGRYAELDKIDLIKLAKKDARMVVKDNFVCPKRLP